MFLHLRGADKNELIVVAVIREVSEHILGILRDLSNDNEYDADRVRKRYWQTVSNLTAKDVDPHVAIMDDRHDGRTLDLDRHLQRIATAAAGYESDMPALNELLRGPEGCLSEGFMPIKSHPLVVAARRENMESTEALLTRHWERKDFNSRFPQKIAAKWGNLHTRARVENGPDADTRHWSSLLLAATAGHAHVVEYLLGRSDTDLSWSICGRTPRWYATNRGHEDVVELFLRSKRFPLLPIAEERQKSPLYEAVQGGHVSLAKEFLKYVKEKTRSSEPIRVRIFAPMWATLRRGACYQPQDDVVLGYLNYFVVKEISRSIHILY